MEKKITFRSMEHSDIMTNYAHEQLAKIESFLENEREPIYVELILTGSKVHANNRVELLVKTPHYDLVSHHEGPELYELLDRVIDVMYDQLHEKKRQRTHDKKA